MYARLSVRVNSNRLGDVYTRKHDAAAVTRFTRFETFFFCPKKLTPGFLFFKLLFCRKKERKTMRGVARR